MKFESIEHAKHYASSQSLDIVFYQNKIIDVTEFKLKHPGGIDSIYKSIGTDITILYDKVESHQTKSALKDLESFCIGEIKTDNKKKPIENLNQSKNKIDLKKGIVWQVLTKVNLKEYLEFIDDPKHMINPSEAILFENPFFELFTKNTWYVILCVYIPLILYDLYNAYLYMNNYLSLILLGYLFGVFSWTFVEYCLHRFIFHSEEHLPDDNIVIMMHFLLHGIHHAFPMDGNRLVFPPILGLIVYNILGFILSSIIGLGYRCVLAGMISGYVIYDMTHYYIHHSKPKIGYWKSLKEYHILHHYKTPNLGYGVSNKLWDYVFGTMLISDKKLV